jgi:serine/threonine-protein kinase HipA
VEDFCQLAGLPPTDKYDRSAEACVDIVKQYASEPLIEVGKLFRLLVFGWWVSNGDMHLKNFSLLTDAEGRRQLSPAYDLVNTALVIPDDQLALPVGGRKSGLTRRTWLGFAADCGLPARAAEDILSRQVKALGDGAALIRASFLSEPMQRKYETMIRNNTAILSAAD